MEGLLKFYARYLNADGALENLPAWVFVEWSHANDPKLVKEGVNWPSNMTYADVLAKAARLYGRPEASCNHAFASFLAILLEGSAAGK